MAQTVFHGQLRQKAGKGAARQARRDGFIPGVLYGGGDEPLLVQVERTSAERIIRRLESHNIFADLVLKNGQEEKTVNTLVKEIQIDPVTDRVLHIDFFRLKMDRAVQMMVPVRLVGEAPGVKAGGIVDQTLRELRVEALPKDMPGHIDVDVSGLNIGDAILVKDISLGAGIRIDEDETRVVVSVLAPQRVEEAAPAAAEGEAAPAPAEEVAAEPEVITQEKAEERRRAKEQSKAEEEK